MLLRFSIARGLLSGLVSVALSASPAQSAESLVPFRDQIEHSYNARDALSIDETIDVLRKAGKASGQDDLASYYVAFARLRQSAIAGSNKSRTRDYLEACIDELEPLVERRPEYAQARALYASCLGASSNYYVLRAATRGLAAGREMAAAVKLAPENPWVVFQDAVSDFSTPGIFGGDKQRSLGKLQRAEQLFVASRPAGSVEPVFGEAETWLYIGRVNMALGQKDRARVALERARTLAPENTDVRDELAKP